MAGRSISELLIKYGPVIGGVAGLVSSAVLFSEPDPNGPKLTVGEYRSLVVFGTMAGVLIGRIPRYYASLGNSSGEYRDS